MSHVEISGPLFDGRADAAAAAFADEAEVRIAEVGVNMVRTQLDRVLRNPTGYYESQVQTDRSVGDMAINDNGVIYGPWLEGVGSRNRTTRFKGYATFRIVTQELNGVAVRIAEDALPPYLARMGG